jgi:putative lipoic acid-binding regulatory protein
VISGSNPRQEAKVATSNEKIEQAELSYPRDWGFKIIGRDKEKLQAVVKEVMGDKEHLCSPGNSSRTGKYHSYNASCHVESKEERDRLFKAFQDHDDVEMVI